jgi:CRISPR/Cas system-associated exonuclease Cas4 (RecB family)
MNTYWRKLFGWSKTRQALWDECKLAYYYQYIGKWEGFPGDPGRERLQRLSKIKKFVFWKGELIHEVIRNQMALHSRNKPLLEDGARKYFIQQVEEVKQHPKTIITEAVNGLTLSDDQFEAARSDGLKQLDNFFSIIWPDYRERRLLEYERLNSLQVRETKVWVQVDLITQTEEEKTVITDWKTGDERWIDSNADEQMGVYILWAIDRFSVPATQVSAELVFLRSGESHAIVKTQDQLEELKESIANRAKEMLAVQTETDFPPDPANRRCRECNFATICPEGKQRIPLFN